MCLSYACLNHSSMLSFMLWRALGLKKNQRVVLLHRSEYYWILFTLNFLRYYDCVVCKHSCSLHRIVIQQKRASEYIIMIKCYNQSMVLIMIIFIYAVLITACSKLRFCVLLLKYLKISYNSVWLWCNN